MIVESYEDVIVLSGALRQNLWETIHTAISLTLQRYPTGVIIDCSGLQECTPHGAETFRSALNFIEEHHARIIVAAVSRPVETVLNEVPDVRSRLPLAPTVEAARQSLNLLGEHVNLEDQDHKKKKKKENGGGGKIMVVVMGQESDRHVTEVAAGFASLAKAELNLVFPILVPRELPISAPLPEVEALASEVLNNLEDWCEDEELPVVRRAVRARDIPTAIDEAEEGIQADMVVLGLPIDEDQTDSALKLAKSMMTKIETQLIFVRNKR